MNVILFTQHNHSGVVLVKGGVSVLAKDSVMEHFVYLAVIRYSYLLWIVFLICEKSEII